LNKIRLRILNNPAHPQSRFAGQQAGKNSFPPDPLFFLPACSLTLLKILQKATGYKRRIKGINN